jgi:hypothetical protein
VKPKYAVQRIGMAWTQPWIEAKACGAVGAQDRVCVIHVKIDMGMIVRWRCANTVKFPRPDADFRNAAIISKLRKSAWLLD